MTTITYKSFYTVVQNGLIFLASNVYTHELDLIHEFISISLFEEEMDSLHYATCVIVTMLLFKIYVQRRLFYVKCVLCRSAAQK